MYSFLKKFLNALIFLRPYRPFPFKESKSVPSCMSMCTHLIVYTDKVIYSHNAYVQGNRSQSCV